MNDRRESSMYALALAALLLTVPVGIGIYALTIQDRYRHLWDNVWLDVAVGLLIPVAALIGLSLALRRSKPDLAAPAQPPPSPLEQWLQGRIDAADEVIRQRAPRGDGWWLTAMREWDTANCDELSQGDNPVAPELLDNYRRSPTTGLVDGIGPPHDIFEYERYFKERLAWVKHALRASREGTSIQHPLLPTVPDAHRIELQAIAAGLRQDVIPYERHVSYHPPGQDGTILRANAFRTHFPAVVRMLDEWDTLLEARKQAQTEFLEWMDETWADRAFPHPPAIVYVQVIEHGSTELPWVQNDWLTLAGGSGIAQLTDDSDIDAIKRPYDEFLDEALATDHADDLRANRACIDKAKATIDQSLERIEAQHVIRGTCEICASAVGG